MKALEKANKVEDQTACFWDWLFGVGRAGGVNG
jgi:hypothetical protein